MYGTAAVAVPVKLLYLILGRQTAASEALTRCDLSLRAFNAARTAAAAVTGTTTRSTKPPTAPRKMLHRIHENVAPGSRPNPLLTANFPEHSSENQR